jgi:probable rRNA maturation factor
MSIEINFTFNNTKFSLANRLFLKQYLVYIFKNEETPLLSLNYIFCTDAYVKAINKKFLKHDYNTDIITFPLHDTNQPVIGEIYISVDTVRRNAFDLGVSFTNELHRVIFHGALHLCGHNDKTKQQIEAIRDLEDFYLNQFFENI